MAHLIWEHCDTCDAKTLHALQVTPQGEVIRCNTCATVTCDPA